MQALITVFALAGIASLYTWATPYMAWAAFSYSLLCIGLCYRKTDRRFHAKIMITAIISDLILVLVLQLQRQAIQTAVAWGLNPIQMLHILSSSLATLLYIPTLYLGWLLMSSQTPCLTHKRWHIRFASAAFVFRTIGLLLMFSLLARVKA